jgi:hypothetical protein
LLLAERVPQSIQGCNIEIDVLAAEEKNSFAYVRSFGDANAPYYSLLGTVRLAKEHIYRRRGLNYSRIMQDNSQQNSVHMTYNRACNILGIKFR